ncbi:CHAT domain-containing protein [Kordia sp.]|uniref:CHAT domain-containing protein n=1 Tax=Kordia sp. TaxID=1965332 RepID=UPI003B5A690E
MITLRTRIHKFPLILLFLLSLQLLKAQDIQLSPYYNQQIEAKELTFHQKEKLVDSLLKLKNIKVNKIDLAQIYYQLSITDWTSNLERSILYADKVLVIADELKNYKEEIFSKTLCNKMFFLFTDEKFNKALKVSQEYVDLYKSENTILGKVFCYRGNIYSELGDLQKSLDSYDKSIYIFKKIKDNGRLTDAYVAKLAAYVSVEDITYDEKIKELAGEIKKIKESADLFPEQEMAFKFNMGYFYDFLGDYKKAGINYTEALEIALEEEDFENAFEMYTNLGVLSKKENNLEEALLYFLKASEYVFDKKYLMASNSNNLADIYQIKNNHKKALIHYQNAITQVLQAKELDYQKLPSFEDIELSPNKLDILGYLIDKANGWIAYYEAEKKPEYLQYALETFTLADQLIDVIYVRSREDLSKLFWRKKSAAFYPNAVEVCYRLQQPEKAFFFMEKNKAMLLLENMTNATAKRLSKLPEKVLEREQNLIKEIKALEAEIQTITNLKNQQTDVLKNNMFNYKKEYNAFIDSLEINHPKYYNYKKNINIVTLKDVQKNLQSDEIVLQYIVGKEKGFVALISAQNIQLKELPNTKTLTTTVATYKNAVSKPFVSKNDKSSYQTIAKKLYEQLIPFGDENIFSQKRITIIADGILQYIPFEALVMPNNTYFIKNAEIHYNYSLSSAAQSQQNKTQIGKTFIAIAPTKFRNNQHATLKTSALELKKLTDIFEANHFQYEKATKEQFIEAYGNYKIIHLSTHGGIDNTIPWMAFYDEKMTLDELYFTKNQSELVVLSACKTSDGELKKGEGVMSLARGFFNAGAKSVVSSLWDINEKASNEIIQEFYKNIANGDTKSAALQKAKLTYIKNNQNTSEASPYYWSALTITGDIKPIYKNGYLYIYYLLGAILLTGIVVYIRSKRKTKQAA